MAESGKRIFLGSMCDLRFRGPLENAQALARQMDYVAREKAVPLENLHITYHFLGSVPPAEIDLLERAMAALPPVSVVQTFDHWVAFPTPKQPTVLGLGAKTPAPGLAALVKTLAETIEGLGLSVDHRAFYPHVTLFRFKHAHALDLSKLLPVRFELPITGWQLIESRTGSEHSHYEILGQYGLAPA